MSPEWSEIINSLNRSAELIGADRTNWKLLSKELLDIKRKLEAGDPITREELLKLRENWKSDRPFIDSDGNYFVLYIDDQSVSSWWGGHRNDPKFHIAWCSTLDIMDRIGRRGRYKAKYDIENNEFKIYNGRRTTKKLLKVCKVCLKMLAYKGYTNFNGTNEAKIYYEFDMHNFFQEHNVSSMRGPTHQFHQPGYAKDWSIVSQRMKEQASYICGASDCKKLSTELHVHHINGVKSDNREDNLIVLCKDCHSKQPLHGHMR